MEAGERRPGEAHEEEDPELVREVAGRRQGGKGAGAAQGQRTESLPEDS